MFRDFPDQVEHRNPEQRKQRLPHTWETKGGTLTDRELTERSAI